MVDTIKNQITQVNNKKINSITNPEKIFTENFKKRLIIWSTILIAGITLETFLREKFYDIGIKFIKILQIYMKNKPLLTTLFQFLSFFGNKNFVISLITLSFILIDIYSSFLIMIIATCASTATGFFKIIYKNPRPFFHENWINVYDCETGYGNPSGHSIVAVSIFLTLNKILLKKSNLEKSKKKLLGIFNILLIIMIMISRIALGSHSLNQIFFGAFFGGLIYALFFEVFKINFAIKEEMRIIINPFIMKLFLSITGFIFLLGFIVFYFPSGENVSDLIIWEKRILEVCPNTTYSKLFDYESIFMLCSFVLFHGSYMGLYYDIHVNYVGNLESWIDENYGENKWNNSSLMDSFKRLVLFGIFAGSGVSLHFIIKSDNSAFLIFFFKNLIPYFMASFIIYGFNRKIFSYFKIGCK